MSFNNNQLMTVRLMLSCRHFYPCWPFLAVRLVASRHQQRRRSRVSWLLQIEFSPFVNERSGVTFWELSPRRVRFGSAAVAPPWPVLLSGLMTSLPPAHAPASTIDSSSNTTLAKCRRLCDFVLLIFHVSYRNFVLVEQQSELLKMQRCFSLMCREFTVVSDNRQTGCHRTCALQRHFRP